MAPVGRDLARLQPAPAGKIIFQFIPKCEGDFTVSAGDGLRRQAHCLLEELDAFAPDIRSMGSDLTHHRCDGRTISSDFPVLPRVLSAYHREAARRKRIGPLESGRSLARELAGRGRVPFRIAFARTSVRSDSSRTLRFAVFDKAGAYSTAVRCLMGARRVPSHTTGA